MSTPSKHPQPDLAEILNALAVLFEPSDIIELRAIHKGKKRTDAGYFDGEHREELANSAVKLNAQSAAVYVTLNTIDSQLLGRYCNRIERFAAATATDNNVIRRRWLLIDLDPVRPKETSATNEQLEAAKKQARICYQELKTKGWPEPLAGESGNGWHLLYPLDLVNNAKNRDLVKGALAQLAQQFDTEEVTVDQSVFNAGRITKLYGTVATKGDHTLHAPWRVSRLISTPNRSTVVTAKQLQALHPTKTNHESPPLNQSHQNKFNLSDFMARLGIIYEQDQHEGNDRYKLSHCPFNPDHGKGEAAIFQLDNGALVFRCMHNSCSDKKWQDLRTLVDGPRKSKGQRPERGPTQTGVTEVKNWPDPLPLSADTMLELYPLDALPDTLRSAVEEVLAFTKAPVPLVASSALAALSLAVQAHADVMRAEKLSGPVGIFLLTIADSGERKSTSDEFFMQSIREYEANQTEEAKPLVTDHKAAMEAWDAKRGGIKEKIRSLAKTGKPTYEQEVELRQLEHDKPKALRVPRLIYGDSTPEALKWNLAKDWPSSGVISSEAGLVFGAHGMGKDSVMRNLATLNQLWDGAEIATERRTSESFTVRGARLTIALQAQEATLRTFFERSSGLARGTGFLARFLVAWPESTQGYRLFTDPPKSWPALAKFNQRISSILEQDVPINEDGALSPQIIPLTGNTKDAWISFHDQIESKLRSGGELYDVRDVASKTADNAARIATLFQIFEHGISNTIGLKEFEGASRIAAWHLNEARRFYGKLALSEDQADAARLDKWLIDYCQRENLHIILRREIQRNVTPVHLRRKAALEFALLELDEAGRIRLVQNGKRKEIHINPALLKGDM